MDLIEGEVDVLRVLLYRNASQHRRAKYFRRCRALLKQAERCLGTAELLGSIRSACAALQARRERPAGIQQAEVAVVGATGSAAFRRLRETDGLLSLAVSAARSLRSELRMGHFMPLCTALLACAARLFALHRRAFRDLLDAVDGLHDVSLVLVEDGAVPEAKRSGLREGVAAIAERRKEEHLSRWHGASGAGREHPEERAPAAAPSGDVGVPAASAADAPEAGAPGPDAPGPAGGKEGDAPVLFWEVAYSSDEEESTAQGGAAAGREDGGAEEETPWVLDRGPSAAPAAPAAQAAQAAQAARTIGDIFGGGAGKSEKKGRKRKKKGRGGRPSG